MLSSNGCNAMIQIQDEPSSYNPSIHPMKTMIRIAAGMVAALFAGVSTNCAPTRYVVHDVYRYDHYHNYSSGSSYTPPTYYGNVNYTPSSYGARSFEPVERF
jgi:hypothetical protein